LYSFIKIPEYLKRAKSVYCVSLSISNTITSTDKLIWCHMLSKYLSYTNSGNEYFETQEQISESTGVSLTVTKLTLRKLKQLGVIGTQKHHTTNHRFCTLYTKVKDPTECESLQFYDIKGNVLLKTDFLITPKQTTEKEI
jgi:hypothetical protein